MSNDTASQSFAVSDRACVAPGEAAHFRYEVGETYLGDPISVPVTVVNGTEPGPRLLLAAAVHGDELNGVEVVRRVATDWVTDDLAGTLVCLHVVNVPGFNGERYLPPDDTDLNRAFPGNASGNAGQRIAHEVFRRSSTPATSASTSTRRPAAAPTCPTSAPTSTTTRSNASPARTAPGSS